MNRSPTESRVLEVRPQASALLDLLVELGHLEDPLLDRVNDRLLDLAASEGGVSLDDVRRVAAEVIFDGIDEVDEEHRRVLVREWRLLFG